MNTKSIDLRKCRPGDKLLSKKGNVVTYLGNDSGNFLWPHRIQYIDGGIGTRTNDGFVFSANRWPEDDDIVKILSPNPAQKETLAEANYTYVRRLAPGLHLLKDLDNNQLEVFVCNKNHASWGLIWNNTHLEFVATYQEGNWVK